MNPDKYREGSMPTWLNILTGAIIALLVLGIAAIGFYGSFTGVREAVRPYLGDDAWIAPVGVDVGILALTALDLRTTRAAIGLPWLRYLVWFLSGLTIYFNAGAADDVFGKAVHAAFPVLYITVVEAIRSSLAKLTIKERRRAGDDGPMEPLPWNWWLTPFSTFGMWYRRRRYRIKTLDELAEREQARQLAVMRLKARAETLSRPWWPKWKKEATPEELWAIATYALSPEGAMRRTAAAVTRDTLAAPAHARPGPRTHTGEAPAHAEPRTRTAAHPPAPAARTHDVVHDPGPGVRDTAATGDEKWNRLMADPDGVRAWEAYQELRTETGKRPGRVQVRQRCGTSKDVTTVSRWLKLFDERWKQVQAAAPVHDHEPAAHPSVHEPVHAAGPGAHEGVHVHARQDELPAHTANGKLSA